MTRFVPQAAVVAFRPRPWKSWINDTNSADRITIPLPDSYTSQSPLNLTAIAVRIVRDDNGTPIGIRTGLGFIPRRTHPTTPTSTPPSNNISSTTPSPTRRQLDPVAATPTTGG